MIVIPSCFYSSDDSIKEGATLTVCVPTGDINNSDDLNFEINLVDVTRVEPINSPILSWVSLKGSSHHWPHLLPKRFTSIDNKALKKRLFTENKNIFKRVNEISKIAALLNERTNDKINFSNLLFEITKRTLNENKFESNLFFL